MLTACVMLDAGEKSENQARSAAQGRQLDLSFRLRLVALGSVRHRLRQQLEDGTPDADLELASKEAPSSGAHMALVRTGLELHSPLHSPEMSPASEVKYMHLSLYTAMRALG